MQLHPAQHCLPLPCHPLLQLCLLDGQTELSCSEDPASPMVSATAAQAGGKTIEVRVRGVDERTSNLYTLNISVQ